MMIAESLSTIELVVEFLQQRGPYLLFIFLTMFGFYLMLTHRNTLKGMVGLVIFQTGIIIFFIFLAVIGSGQLSTLPILDDEHRAAYKKDKKLEKPAYTEAQRENLNERNPEIKIGDGLAQVNEAFEDPKKSPNMIKALEAKPVHNPLPHALMLTAIVVGVATLGVAIAIMMRMNKELGTIEDRPLEGEDDD